MTETQPTDDRESVSRRNLFLGAAAAAGAGAVLAGALPGSGAGAGAAPRGIPHAEVLGTQSGTLTYLPLDGLAFDTATSSGATGRYNDALTGVGVLGPPDRLITNLPLPVGSVIRQLNFAYQGTPIVEIFARSLTANPAVPGQLVSTSLTAGPQAKTQTLELNQASGLLQPVTIQPGFTYTLRLYCGPGDSIYGATVGYTSGSQTFIPFAGATPRVLDTREPGPLTGLLAAGEERTVNLGFAGVRSAVLNLAITGTVGAGFVSVYPANIAWPGNASINWSEANQNISNGVITAVDGTSSIKIRAGANPTHVIIDRIGWLL